MVVRIDMLAPGINKHAARWILVREEESKWQGELREMLGEKGLQVRW